MVWMNSRFTPWTRGLGGVLLNLAQDWELTPFAAIPPIGRYAFDSVLPTGGSGVLAAGARVLAVSPTDTRMRGHWAWSWVMAYEMDYTNGIDANNYGPDMEMSREEWRPSSPGSYPIFQPFLRLAPLPRYCLL